MNTKNTRTKRLISRQNKKRRFISVSVREKAISRNRHYSRLQQYKKEVYREKQVLQTLINKINTGKIKTLSQIPVRFRGILKVSQPMLNAIYSYHHPKGNSTFQSKYKNRIPVVKNSNSALKNFPTTSSMSNSYNLAPIVAFKVVGTTLKTISRPKKKSRFTRNLGSAKKKGRSTLNKLRGPNYKKSSIVKTTKKKSKFIRNLNKSKKKGRVTLNKLKGKR